jgi:hypothetical protein
MVNHWSAGYCKTQFQSGARIARIREKPLFKKPDITPFPVFINRFLEDIAVVNINAAIDSSGLFLRAHLKDYVLLSSNRLYKQSN